MIKAVATEITIESPRLDPPVVFKQWWWSAATSLRKGDIDGNGEGGFVFKTQHMEQCHEGKSKYPIYMY
jgi:hypothetical protein